jgi:hypothetical protein
LSPAELLKKNFIFESLNLARRVKMKYRRSQLAVRAFQVGIFYLIVGGISFLAGFANSAGKTNKALYIYPTYLNRTLLFLVFVVYMAIELVAVRDQALYETRDWYTRD